MMPEGPPTPQRPTRQESKADATDRAAREIIRDEGAARDAKTAALRAARLEREGTETAPDEKPAKGDAAKKSKARKPAKRRKTDTPK
ncbi:hypothetical protein [Citreimonas sp.]|uniref:hypothetical protein n=1 Tax=Citreimonas sp. TaxID=3036715 RepID=UPI004058E8A6